MPLQRRQVLASLAAATAASALPTLSRGQASYPSRPVRIFVPFPPGTSPDVVARQWGERFTRITAQPVVVENRPGASSIIAAQAAAAAPADGTTLLWTVNHTFSINPFVFRKLPYSAAGFEPVTQVLTVPYVLLVSPDAPWRTLAELLADARARPDALTFASAGIGSGLHVAMAKLLAEAGVRMTHIPYKDNFIPDVIGRRVDAVFDASTTAIPQSRGGRVRAIGVSTPKRLEMLPEVPAIAELLPEFSAMSWQGIFVPRGTPADVIQVLAQLSNQIVAAPDFRALLRDYGLPPVGSSPADFRRFLEADAAMWSQVVRAHQISAE